MNKFFINKKFLAFSSVFLVVALASSVFFHYRNAVSVEASGVVSFAISQASAYAPGEEMLAQRTENGKKYFLGNNKYALDVSIGAIHYKDNYFNPQEQWKDIDLTFIEGRITKAPYILSVNQDDKSFTIQDKKTGKTSSIKLLKIGAQDIANIEKKAGAVSKGKVLWNEIVPGLDIAVTAQNTKVNFDWIVKNEAAPHEVEFDIQDGGIPIMYRGIDADGKSVNVTAQKTGSRVVEHIEKGGKYPKIINPTIDVEVSANSDDCLVFWVDNAWYFNITENYSRGVGEEWGTAGRGAVGAGFRFQSISIPDESIITTSYMTFYTLWSCSATSVMSKFTGNKQNNPATFSTLSDFQNRRGTIAGGANNNYITSAQVNWDNISAWTSGNTYPSPEIKTIIQELVDAHAPNNEALVIFWDDYDKRSSGGAYRLALAYWGYQMASAQLHIEYSFTPEVGVWWIEDYPPEDGDNLPYSYESAVGFMDRLLGSSWVRGFNGVGQFGDNNVQEVQFKKVGSGNGDDDDYSDGVDIAYFSGHGGAGVINGNINGPRLTSQNDDKYVEYSECQWGDVDLEWIMFDCCQTLHNDTARQAWHSSMNGLHLICGAITIEYNDDNGVHVSDLLIDDGWWDYARTVKTSWFQGMDYDNPSSVQLAVIGESDTCGDDYIHGQGTVCPDPTHDGSYSTWTFQCT